MSEKLINQVKSWHTSVIPSILIGLIRFYGDIKKKISDMILKNIIITCLILVSYDVSAGLLEELDHELAKRINELPQDLQAHISHKLLNNLMPYTQLTVDTLKITHKIGVLIPCGQWSPNVSTFAAIESYETDNNNIERIQVWRPPTDYENMQTIHLLYPVKTIAWSPDSCLISASDDNSIMIWHLIGPRCIQTFPVNGLLIYTMEWSPEGARLAAGGLDGTIKIWQLKLTDDRCMQICPGHTGLVYALAWRPDGHVLASYSDDVKIKIWDACNGRCIQTIQNSDQVLALAWSPDGSRLATGSNNGTIRIWQAVAGRCIQTLHGSGRTNVIAWSPDSVTIASGSSYDKTIKIWQAVTGRCIQTLQDADWVIALAWNPDSSELVSGSAFGVSKRWNVSKPLLKEEEWNYLKPDHAYLIKLLLKTNPEERKRITRKINGSSYPLLKKLLISIVEPITSYKNIVSDYEKIISHVNSKKQNLKILRTAIGKAVSYLRAHVAHFHKITYSQS